MSLRYYELRGSIPGNVSAPVMRITRPRYYRSRYTAGLYSIYFPGSVGGYIYGQVSGYFDISYDHDYSYSLWSNWLGGSSTIQYLVVRGTSIVDGLRLTRSSKTLVAVAGATSSSAIGALNSGVNVWQHILITYSSGTRNCKVYIDGVQKNSFTGGVTSSTGIIPYFGSLSPVSTASYSGHMYKMAYWNRTLTSGEAFILSTYDFDYRNDIGVYDNSGLINYYVDLSTDPKIDDQINTSKSMTFGSSKVVASTALPTTSGYPTLSLQVPNGTSSFVLGSGYTLSWLFTGRNEPLDLDLYKNGNHIQSIVSGLNATSLSYLWTVPIVLSPDTLYTVKATLRFFQVSSTSSNFAIVDELASQATNPSPYDGQIAVSINDPTLSWTAGAHSVSHKVYFGISGSTLEDRGSQVGTTYIATGLNYSSNYMWRIDEVNSIGTVTTGSVWYFNALRTPADQVVYTYPSDTFTGIHPYGTTLSWNSATNAVNYDVYLGLTNPPSYITQQSSLSYDTGSLVSGQTYYWRVNSVNADNLITTGLVYSFTTHAWANNWSIGDNSAGMLISSVSTGLFSTPLDQSFTNAGWIYWGGAGDATQYVWVKVQSNNSAWRITTSNRNFAVIFNGGTPYIVSGILSPNIWHHIACTYSYGNTPKFYFDGVYYNWSGLGTIGPTGQADSWFYIGNSSASANPLFSFSGYISELAHWSGELSSAEIGTLASTPFDLRTNYSNYVSVTNLKNYLLMGDGLEYHVGNKVYDLIVTGLYMFFSGAVNAINFVNISPTAVIWPTAASNYNPYDYQQNLNVTQIFTWQPGANT